MMDVFLLSSRKFSGIHGFWFEFFYIYTLSLLLLLSLLFLCAVHCVFVFVGTIFYV